MGMSLRRTFERLALFGGTAAGLAGLFLAYRVSPSGAFFLLLLTALPAGAYVLWYAHPAAVLSAGIGLAIFSGSWKYMGFPELIAPDRLLIAAAIATVVLRAPQVRDRMPIEVRPIHWLLAITTAYIAASALAAGTFFSKASTLRLVDRVGVVGFVLFALAPAIFPTARHRSMLLGSLVAVGLYLAVTSFFETLGVTALVFPRYISDPNVGIHVGRARGPFLEAVGNGTAIYIGLVAAVIAAITWRVPWQRRVAVVTAVLCAASLVFTLTRSVWVGSAVATVATMLAHPRLRRWLLPVAVSATLLTAGTIAVIPGLATKVQTRESSQGPIWDRLNLSRAAINMAEARPLFGFGWDRFKAVGTDYFQQGDFPLTAGVGVNVHSAYLSNLAELGLVGTTLWLLSTVLALWLALRRRGPPELEPWRYGLIAISVLFLVVSSFVYPYLFGVVVLWMWAGIVYGAGGSSTSRSDTASGGEISSPSPS
jgi:putative inorganic carbon (HCO3(-)) transporter